MNNVKCNWKVKDYNHVQVPIVTLDTHEHILHHASSVGFSTTSFVSFEVRGRCEKIVCLDTSISRKVALFGLSPKLFSERGENASFVFVGVEVLTDVRGLENCQ